MSETTTNTSGACELVLDYVYGELDEARKRTFEEHLPTCATCQREVASFGKVRTAVKRVMPAVEPTAQIAGALHAQLMHAAAQRKPRRGVLLSFPRKIVEHPALSAAAMFVLVGGAIAINWSRGKMAMPAAEQTVSDTKVAEAPKPTEAPAEPVVPEPKAKEEEAGEKLGKIGTISKGGDKTELAKNEDATKIALETPSGPMTVQRPTAHRAVATPAPKKAAPARMKTVATDGKQAKFDTAFADDKGQAEGSLGSVNGRGAGTTTGSTKGNNGPVGGVIGGGGQAGAKDAPAKSTAPADELSSNTVAEKAATRREEPKPQAAKQHGYTTSPSSAGASATPPAAPPPPQVTASAPATERDYYRSSVQQQAQPVAKPSANARNFDVLQKQASEWAKTGRCAEAIKAYQELTKANQYIPPTERVHWIHCLTAADRQEEAQKRLDELKQEKRVTNAQILDAEKELNDSRKRVDANKKSKKAPAADRAPAQSAETQQRRAADQESPAQAAPPDSTNTKVKPSSSY